MPNEIKLYICKNGHKILEWKECPFCCALNNVKPLEDDETFLEIYHNLKRKSESDISHYYYGTYAPSEPEQVIIPPIWR